MQISKKWSHPIKNWGIIVNQFLTIFEKDSTVRNSQTHLISIYTKV